MEAYGSSNTSLLVLKTQKSDICLKMVMELQQKPQQMLWLKNEALMLPLLRQIDLQSHPDTWMKPLKLLEDV